MRFWPRKEKGNEASQAPREFPAPRACNTCGCLIAFGRGKVVEHLDWSLDLQYCEREGCAPPYDMAGLDLRAGKLCYYKREPARLVRVTEKGKALKAEDK